jgi:hypothetical protein
VSALAPEQDRSVTARLNDVATTLAPLLRQPATPQWQPGLRRGAVLSDLLRALDATLPPNGPAASDPWSVPCGLPDGAELWPTREAATRWLGVDRAVRLSDIVDVDRRPPATPNAAPLLDELADLRQPGRPLALTARRWQTEGAGWLELSAGVIGLGPDGPRSVVAVNATWPDDRSQLSDTTQPGRDGLLLIVAAAVPARNPNTWPQMAGLTAFVHLATREAEREHRVAQDAVAGWRARLFDCWTSRQTAAS